MGLFDQIFLVATYSVSLLALWFLRTRRSEAIPENYADLYHGIALAVMGIASLLLSIYGWGILGIMGGGLSNKLVAIISSLIPFSWATGLISKYFPKMEGYFLVLMVLGLILVTLSRFMNTPLMARIVYPVFHSIAALVVITTPFIAVKKGFANFKFLLVSLGGSLISVAGIALAFLSSGRQLIFFSQDVVLLIFAPLLFLVTTLYITGLSWGELR